MTNTHIFILSLNFCLYKEPYSLISELLYHLILLSQLLSCYYIPVLYVGILSPHFIVNFPEFPFLSMLKLEKISKIHVD